MRGRRAPAERERGGPRTVFISEERPVVCADIGVQTHKNDMRQDFIGICASHPKIHLHVPQYSITLKGQTQSGDGTSGSLQPAV